MNEREYAKEVYGIEYDDGHKNCSMCKFYRAMMKLEMTVTSLKYNEIVGANTKYLCLRCTIKILGGNSDGVNCIDDLKQIETRQKRRKSI